MLVERQRVVAQAHVGGVVHGLGDRGADAAEAELPHAFGLDGRGDRVHLVKEDHLLVQNVRAQLPGTAKSSVSAAPTPVVMALITWLRADFGLRMRPAAQTPAACSPRPVELSSRDGSVRRKPEG